MLVVVTYFLRAGSLSRRTFYIRRGVGGCDMVLEPVRRYSLLSSPRSVKINPNRCDQSDLPIKASVLRKWLPRSMLFPDASRSRLMTFESRLSPTMVSKRAVSKPTSACKVDGFPWSVSLVIAVGAAAAAEPGSTAPCSSAATLDGKSQDRSAMGEASTKNRRFFAGGG